MSSADSSLKSFSNPRAGSGRLPGKAAVALLAGTMLLAGCTPTISVRAGVDATEPICAKVVLTLPDEVLGQKRVKTNSQATAAWGEPGSAITFTCGVEPPQPTTEDCQSITAQVFGEEQVFDWITNSTDNGFTFVSYGRSPAMMVQVPASLDTPQPTAALLDVASAVAKVEATSACI
ncbi:DUF3515 family protein [Timonella sp. A28]|uniref:DUF3515 family protein n=1 Tax=Timonella sp. A28 TaxID=3442640 RepID=UPI003EB86251